MITIGSAAAFGWLGWEMLRQDAAAEAQRATGELGREADRAIDALSQRIRDMDDRLLRWLDSPASPIAPPKEGIIVTFSAATAELTAPARLLFQPVPPPQPEWPPTLFADGEAAEYRERDPSKAARLYRRVAESRDAAIRAAALMRAARVLRNAGDADGAIALYREMAALGSVPVIGVPAELVAQHAESEVLNRTGRLAESSRIAHALLVNLDAARWRLTRPQWEHYRSAAAVLAGVTLMPHPDAALAESVAELWTSWQRQPVHRLRRLARIGTTSWLVLSHGTPERAASWVVMPQTLVASVTSTRIDVALSDADGALVAGSPLDAAPAVARTAAETGLPWTLHARSRQATGQTSMTRGRLVVATLAAMVMFLIAGSYFIGRAVKREMDLARLQSEFVSAVSHEFRTPLAAMRQLSELLAEGRVPQDDRCQHYYDALAAESRRLQRLVENLLNFGRLEAGATPYQLAPLDARELVEHVIGEFRSQLTQPDCRIEIAAGSAAVTLLADRDAVALALHNLVDNAVKYSGRTGIVRIDWHREGDRVALRVQDDGPGISAEERARIFQKFVRGTAAAAANVRGTGVGLAMVQLVVLGHGGEILLDSETGAGATFTLLLPAAQTA